MRRHWANTEGATYDSTACYETTDNAGYYGKVTLQRGGVVTVLYSELFSRKIYDLAIEGGGGKIIYVQPFQHGAAA